ncbi:tetratricopeptide repeat protein [Streptosporangium sp. NPDC048047]|uniref:nSTAND1 domain-containing NTPase n=1 Tax=Streptosporangium sp. NPDC048047 TaxID=3155748 RepID=UPI003428C41E
MDHGPYIGLRAFRTEESRLFFGRERESRQVAGLWKADRLTLLTGGPGVGKTSLLNAGVRPLLAPERMRILPLGRLTYASSFPIVALPEHNPYVLALLASWFPHESPARLAATTISGHLRRYEAVTGRFTASGPLMAAIDQAEELFNDREDRRHVGAFVGELAAALDDHPGLHLLLAGGEEFADLFEPYRARFGAAAGSEVVLAPLDRDAATRAVRGPSKSRGRPFAPGAAEELVDDLRSVTLLDDIGRPVASPADAVYPALVQMACSSLWETFSGADVITGPHLRREGGAERFLGETWRRVVSGVATDHDLYSERLLNWLGRALTAGPSGRARVGEREAEASGVPGSVLRALAALHLLRSEAGAAGSREYTLYDDRLAAVVRGLAAGGPVPAVPPAPTSSAASLHAAVQALARGETALARGHVRRIVEAGDDELRPRAEAWSLLGNIACEEGDLEAAVRSYDTATTMFEALGDTSAVGRLLAATGRLRLRQGDGALALTLLRAAVERVPNDLTVQTQLGRALGELGRSRAAVAVLNGVLAVDGNTPDALRVRGEILADLGEAEEALRDLDRVPHRAEPVTRAARAFALATLHDFGAADGELAAVLADAPHEGSVLLYGARARAAEGDRAGAADLAGRALTAAGPPLPPHRREVALGLLAASKPDEPYRDDPGP